MLASAVRRSPRLVIWVVTALLLTLWWVPRTTHAFASGTDGGFEIDGNVVSNGASDWNTVKSAPDGLDNLPSDSTVLSASSKEDDLPKTWTASGSPPSKVDIIDTWVYTHNDGTTPYVDFAWTRSGQTGTGGFYLELNKLDNYKPGNVDNVPQRSNGDARFEIKATGSNTLELVDVSHWSGDANSGSWVSDPNFDSTGFDYAVNSTTVTPPGADPIAANGFVEVSLDLKTLLGLAPSCPPAFGTVNFRAFTGDSDKNLEDVVKGLKAAAGSTCSKLTIHKTAAGSGDPLGGATFRISPDPTPPGGVAGSHLDVTDNGGNDASSADGTIVIDPAAPRTYSVQEITAPPGYLKASPATQSGINAPASGSAAPVTFVDPLGSVTWEKTDKVTGDPVGGATFNVSSDPSGSYSQDVTDNGAGDESSNTAGTMSVSGLKTGDYTITETQAPTGYVIDSTVAHFTISDATPNPDLGVAFEDPHQLSTLVVQKNQIGDNPSSIDGAHFTLFRVKEGNEAADVAVGSCVSGVPNATTGRCSIGGLDWGHSYYWEETVAPPGYNLPDDNTEPDSPIQITKDNAGTTFPVTKFADDTSQISTSATDATLGNDIFDTATLSHVRAHASGSISFAVYGPYPIGFTPNSDSCTADKLVTTLTNNGVNGPGNYGSGAFAPSQAGIYLWVASYSGDKDGSGNFLDVPVAGTCGDQGETSGVGKVDTSVTTHATDAQLLGDPATISDSADLHTVTSDATGTLTFAVFAAGSNCTGSPLDSFVVNVEAGTTHYTSGDYLPTAAGDYDWLVTYSGDNNNNGSSETCGAQTDSSNEVSHVAKADTAVTTHATDGQLLGNPGTISDSADLGGVTGDAGGTVTFAVFAPGTDCQDVALESFTVNVTAGTTHYTSGDYTPTATGDYQWLVTYSGDINNNGSSEACGALTDSSHEVSHVDKAAATMTTVADAAATLPAQGLPGGTAPTVQDVATLAGVTPDAGGTVTFDLFGPSDTADCSGTPVFESADRPVAAGTAVSEPWSVTGTGHYWWTAHYSGDANNTPADETCGSANEDTTVTQADLTIAKGADPTPGTTVQPGDQIDYTVDVTNSGDAAADGVTVVDTLPAHVTVVAGTISNGGVLDATAGTITWTLDLGTSTTTTLTYSVTVDADAPQGSVLHNVAALGDQQAATDHPVAAGGLTLHKSVDPTTGVEFGDTLTYTLVAHATGTLDEHSVVVSDVVPDNTTYVADSAACDGTPCTTSYDATSRTVRWALGDMAHGASRSVSFQVTIDTPATTANGVPAATIVNVGHVQSTETPSTPSNKVKTVVAAVLGVTHTRTPEQLPFTGAPISVLAWAALALAGVGQVLVLAGRRRRHQGEHADLG